MPPNNTPREITTINEGMSQTEFEYIYSLYTGLSVGSSTSKGLGKGKKKAAAGEEKDGPIYPTKSNSARYVSDFMAIPY